MADSTKTFITRIKQKFDTYSNWESTSTTGKGGNLVLLRGEVAVSYLQASGNDRSLDKYFIKIGDGTTPYKDLPYITTVDSLDVPSWAKQNELPLTSTGTGDIVKGATFGTWTVGTETFEGLILEKTNTLGTVTVDSLYATNTVKVANPTDSTQTFVSIVPTAVSIVGTNSTTTLTGSSVTTNQVNATTISATTINATNEYVTGQIKVATPTSNSTQNVVIGTQSVSVTGKSGTITTTSTIGTNSATIQGTLSASSMLLTNFPTTTEGQDALPTNAVVTKKFVEEQIGSDVSNKADKLGSDTNNYLSYVDSTDGSYKRSGIKIIPSTNEVVFYDAIGYSQITIDPSATGTSPNVRISGLLHATRAQFVEATVGYTLTTNDLVVTNNANLTSVLAANATISTLLDANGTVTLDGTKVLKTLDVKTATDATYLTNATLLGQQIVNKKYVDGIASGKADLVSTSSSKNVAFVDTDGQYKRLTGVYTDGTSTTSSDYVSVNWSTGNVSATQVMSGYGVIEQKLSVGPTLASPIFSVESSTNQVRVGKNTIVEVPKTPTANSEVANKKYVDDAILDAVTAAVVFKGATATLPTNSGTGSVTIINGDMYKASGTITILPTQSADGNATITVKAGDTIIADVTPSTTQGDPDVVTWWYIPSADEDTWRPVQVKGTSLASNTVNFADGSHTTASYTTTSGVSSVVFNHNSVGATSATKGATNTFVTQVEHDAYNHITGVKEVSPVNGNHTTVSIDSTSVKWSHNSPSTASTTIGSTSTATSNVTLIQGAQFDQYGHLTGSSKTINVVNGSNTTVSVAANATQISINHNAAPATTAAVSTLTISASAGYCVTGIKRDAYGHVADIEQTILPNSLDNLSVTGTSPWISVEKTTTNGTTTYTISHGSTTTATNTLDIVTFSYDGYIAAARNIEYDDKGHIAGTTTASGAIKVHSITVPSQASTSRVNTIALNTISSTGYVSGTITINTTDAPILVNVGTDTEDIINFAIDQSWFDQNVVPTDATASNVNKIATVKYVDNSMSSKANKVGTYEGTTGAYIDGSGQYQRNKNITITHTSDYENSLTYLTSNGYRLFSIDPSLSSPKIVIGTQDTRTDDGKITINGQVSTDAASIVLGSSVTLTVNKTPATKTDAANKKYVDDRISGLDSTITASGSAATTQVSVFTKITETNGKLATTNTTSVLLATVASTGKIEDLTQTDYVIFDCGDSTTTV